MRDVGLKKSEQFLHLSFFVFAPQKAWRVGAQGLRALGLRALTNWGLAKAAESSYGFLTTRKPALL